MALKQKMSRRKVLASLLILVLGGLLLINWQRQYIYDELRLLDYTPSAQIEQLAIDSTMTGTAKRYFYVNHPGLQSRDSFSKYCPVGTEQTVVLGCYKSGQRGIYLLQVSNAELKGIEQVTAAHEMLHAAYDRLGDSQRQRIDGLLQDYYNKQLSDESIKASIADYRKTEPNDLVNEMHSIFGTQIANLPSDLEEYYRQYFSDRSKVVALYDTYEQAFSSRQQRVKNYDKQLNSSKAEIDSLQASVEQQQANLKVQRSTLDSYRANDNVAAYNAGVGTYNNAVGVYNSGVERLQNLIASYNALVAKRNSIAFEERQLVESISAPAATQ